MSTNENLDRPPKEEIGKRVAEAGAGLAAAVRAGEVQHYVAGRSAYRRRLEDDHKLQMRLNGMEDDDLQSPEDDGVGDIIVTGDIYGNEAVEMLSTKRGQQKAEIEPQPQIIEPEPSVPEPIVEDKSTQVFSTLEETKPSLLKKTLPYILTAALTAGGGYTFLKAAGMINPKQSEVVDTDTDTGFMIALPQ